MKGNLKTIVKKIERSGSLPPMPEAEFDKLAASLPKNEQGLIIRDALDAVDKQEYDELTILFDNYYTNTQKNISGLYITIDNLKKYYGIGAKY